MSYCCEVVLISKFTRGKEDDGPLRRQDLKRLTFTGPTRLAGARLAVERHGCTCPSSFGKQAVHDGRGQALLRFDHIFFAYVAPDVTGNQGR